ncbi:MAG TPA: threonine aldolase family protein [Solirubrobacteraceae bacterium]
MVDLSSDTQTRPTEAMRQAIATAEVGDEQKREDPTVNALQERVAELLGKEAALFLPSGSMCNGISYRLHLRPGGDEVYLHRTAHPIIAEAGGPAALSGAMVCGLDGAGGMFTPETLAGTLREEGNRYLPRSRLVSVEQTSNMGGGRVWPLDQVRGVLDVARGRGLRAHMDGARLMNAVVASGVPAAEWTAGFDTCWVDFSKGLGAPVGACLAASAELIEEAFRYKQQWGGSMRQAGIIAAAGLYALDHHVDRLADDHARARRLAEGLASVPGVSGLDPAVADTNIVIFSVPDPAAWATALLSRGVRVSPAAGGRLRAVTHLDVDDAGIESALGAAAEVSRELASAAA